MELSCWSSLYLPETLVAEFKTKGSISIKELPTVTDFPLYRNQGVILNQSLLGIYDSVKQQIRRLKIESVTDMKPGSNKDLQLLYDMFWNPEIKVILVDAIAGSGKTSTAMAFANYLAINPRTRTFDHLVLTRANTEVGAGHGFLPGTLEEKVEPLLGAYYQWLERLAQVSIQQLKVSETLIVQPIAYIRGMDITNSLLIIDEAQNLSRHELKTVLTRVGENTKVVIMGDSSPNQIDVKSLNSENNGLAHVKERFYGEFDWFGYVELHECLRGPICAAATQLL